MTAFAPMVITSDEPNGKWLDALVHLVLSTQRNSEVLGKDHVTLVSDLHYEEIISRAAQFTPAPWWMFACSPSKQQR